MATQSLSVLGVLLTIFHKEAEPQLFFALCLFLVGGAFYLGMILLITYRLAFVRLSAAEFSPPYWINGGAAAVTTLAGSMLVIHAPEAAFLQAILPFLHGTTLFFWAVATWWLPLLVVLSLWRRLFMRVSLAYDPRYWGVVFPLGMYTLCTFYLAEAEKLSFLLVIAGASIYVALAAWSATFLAMLGHLARRRRSRNQR